MFPAEYEDGEFNDIVDGYEEDGQLANCLIYSKISSFDENCDICF